MQEKFENFPPKSTDLESQSQETEEQIIAELDAKIDKFFSDASYWDAPPDSDQAREYREGIDKAAERIEELADEVGSVSEKRKLLKKAIDYREEALEIIGRAGFDKDWRAEQFWDLHRLYEKRKGIKTFVEKEGEGVQEKRAEKFLNLCLKGLSDPQVIFKAERRRLEDRGLPKIEVLKSLAEVYEDFYKKVWESELKTWRKEELARQNRKEYDEKYGLALWREFFQAPPEELNIKTEEELKALQALYFKSGLAQEHFPQNLYRKRVREIRIKLNLAV